MHAVACRVRPSHGAGNCRCRHSTAAPGAGNRPPTRAESARCAFSTIDCRGSAPAERDLELQNGRVLACSLPDTRDLGKPASSNQRPAAARQALMPPTSGCAARSGAAAGSRALPQFQVIRFKAYLRRQPRRRQHGVVDALVRAFSRGARRVLHTVIWVAPARCAPGLRQTQADSGQRMHNSSPAHQERLSSIMQTQKMEHACTCNSTIPEQREGRPPTTMATPSRGVC